MVDASVICILTSRQTFIMT